MKKRKCIGCGKRLYHEKKYKPILVCRPCHWETNGIVGWTLMGELPDYYEISKEEIDKYKRVKK